MFSNLATKLALKKMGLPSDPLSLISSDLEPKKKPTRKLTKNGPAGSVPGLDDMDGDDEKWWPAWMSVKALPLTVQPWLTPTPPPIPVADPPQVGDLAPLDRDRELTFGGGRMVLVVFLRCVGCAFAQKTFLSLRALATKYPRDLTCIAVSHSSAAATKKWLDLVGGGGTWNVQLVIDEDRAVYAAWGLGLGSVWYVLNPASQVAGFKEKGWLGSSVAGSLSRTGVWKGVDTKGGNSGGNSARQGGGGGGAAMNMSTGNGAGVVGSDLAKEEGPTTLMGNKWQQAGAWAVDGRGKIVWGGKAARVDDVMDLEAGVRALGLA